MVYWLLCFIKNSHYVISLINTISTFGVIPEHWAVWTSTLNDKNGNPITNNLKDSDIVKLTVFSWGKNKYFINTNVSFDDFRNHVYKVFVYQ
ncbi:hypothetical protein LP090_01905 [Moraxella bovis]|uniref:hypothetical protein n=1 Tax=Moraxella bovis TaxID=476 RepID=UPI0022269DEF|nr:hypothetical protein [Moraxella bovis]UYZ68198.1 hypothetical protein LP122_10635 [Moraxella bovis]UYZ95796.1 hypothetical protein LP121_04350 [Moraxella bovis]UZA43387.1 hypothetical protein LP090_01905 [Moraxella bovis]